MARFARLHFEISHTASPEATVEYDLHGNVDLRAAIVLAAMVFTGACVGAVVANHLSGPYFGRQPRDQPPRLRGR